MHRKSRLLWLPTFAALMATTGISIAAPPASFGAKGAAYTVGDDGVELQPAAIPSSIVWGATPAGYRDCDFARAGNPQSLRKVTIPSNTRFYGGYYVGGGTPAKGAGRCLEDGTWGWDYAGILFTKRISLNWTRNGRPQGGTGAYQTDGPKLRRE